MMHFEPCTGCFQLWNLEAFPKGEEPSAAGCCVQNYYRSDLVTCFVVQ